VEGLCKVLEDINNIGLEMGLSQVTAIAPTENISRLLGASQALDYYPFSKFIQKDHSRSVTFENNHKHFAFEIDQTERLKFIAEVQKHVHQGISCTLFYQSSTGLQQMFQDFIMAWNLGIKTLYYVKTPPLIQADISSLQDVSNNTTSVFKPFVNQTSYTEREVVNTSNGCGGCNA
jgi:ribonucleotide reductase alpha subunit